MSEDVQKITKRIQGLLILIGILLGGVLILFFSIQEKVSLQEARTTEPSHVQDLIDEPLETLTEEDLIEMNLRLDDLNLEI